MLKLEKERIVKTEYCPICRSYKGELLTAGDLKPIDKIIDWVDRVVRCVCCGREM